MSGSEQHSDRGLIASAGAVVLAVLCCFAGPAIFGAVAGAAIGSALGIVAAVACAAPIPVTVILVLRSRRRGGSAGC